MNRLDYPVFSAFAFLGFILSFIPLPWHLQAWNSGTCYYMIWTGLACLNMFINSILWNGTVINFAPVWCDISIRIMLGASVAIPAASLCINRRLYHIARVHAVIVTHAEKRRAIFVDTLLCVLWPLVFIALQYVVQGHRFDIYEDIGCYPYIYNTIVAFFLSDSWPIIFGLVSAGYCVLSLREFYCRRVQFDQYLASNNSLNASRYFRLMALACTEIISTIPIASFMIWLNASAQTVQPWVSWENTHHDFSRVAQYPTVVWSQDYLLVVALQTTRWLPIACAFIFFAYFGFAAEAQKNYRAALFAILRIVGFTLPRSSSQLSKSLCPAPQPRILSIDSLPVYAPKDSKQFVSSESFSNVSGEKYVNFSHLSTPSNNSFLEMPVDMISIPDAAHVV